MRRLELLGLGLLVALRAGTDLRRLALDPLRYVNWEEGVNAGVARALWEAGLWDQLLALQYKTFCGGCAVVSALGAPLLGAGGGALWVWKLLPLAWSAATVVAGAVAARRLAGPAAGRATAALLALPPTGLGDAGLMAWGNHAESGLVVLLALGLAAGGGRGLRLGLLAGLGVWMARAAAPGLAVALALGWRRGARPGRLLAGLALGLLPLALPAAAGDAGRYDLASIDVSEIPLRARALLEPGALGAYLLPGSGAGAWPWLLALGLAAGRLLQEGPRALVAWPAAFALAFALAPIDLPAPGPRAGVLTLRYHAPWLLAGTVLIGAGAGRWWASGRRGVALLIAGLALAVGALGQVRRPPPYAGEVLPLTELSAVDPGRLALHLAGRVEAERLVAASARLPEASLALGIQAGLGQGGEALARRAADPALAAHGLGLALAARGAWPPGLDGAAAQGLAQALSIEALRAPPPPGDPRRQVERAMSSCGGRAPCPSPLVAGAAAARACGGLGERVAPELGLCLRQVLAPWGPEAAFGAALALGGRLPDRARRAALVEALGPEAARGLAHPAAGLSVTVGPEAHATQAWRPY